MFGDRANNADDRQKLPEGEGGYNNRLFQLLRCIMQNGYCLATAFRRCRVSSDGGSSGLSSSLSFLALGCLTILAVGKAVSGEGVGVIVAEMTLDFI